MRLQRPYHADPGLAANGACDFTDESAVLLSDVVVVTTNGRLDVVPLALDRILRPVDYDRNNAARVVVIERRTSESERVRIGRDLLLCDCLERIALVDA